MRTFYTRNDTCFLRDHYLGFSDEKLAKMLGVTKSAIINKRFHLGLKRPPVNWGTGQPRPNPKYCNQKANSGSFRKGRKPENTLPEGAEVLRQDKKRGKMYVYIKKDGKMQLKSRVLWRENSGEIPKNHIIVFRDKNPLNCAMENLECISRAENAARNRNPEKSKETVTETWRFAKGLAELGYKRFWFKNKQFEKTFNKISKDAKSA